MAHILLVDDLPEFIETERQLLQECELGYKVEAASTTEKATELLEHERFDLVILDLMMPKKSGLELLHEIKRRWPGTPVLIYSAYLDRIPETVLYQEGADLVLSKPASLELFINAVKKLVSADSDTTVVIIHGYKVKEIKNQVLATIIQKVLRKAGQNLSRAAELMGISRECLSVMMKRFGIIR